ncbi:hypothetical protein [Marinobacter salicampi]|uniref:hypothetical protein n=1 Tax=Marinobacter salicampi TaxID=435907 RepID=UPI001407EBCD|nr:hypothetical protein [Marinobacter salicampi]
MGYSHYFKKRRKPTADEWEAIERAAKFLIANAPVRTATAGGYCQDDPLSGYLITYVERKDPETGEYVDEAIAIDHAAPNVVQAMEGNPCICFDGVEDLGHETFLMTNLGPEEDRALSPCMWFCKTGRKPYDLLVCGLLILVNDIAPDLLAIRSDGKVDDWEPALQFARTYNDHVSLPKGIDPEAQQQTGAPLSQFLESAPEPGLYF